MINEYIYQPLPENVRWPDHIVVVNMYFYRSASETGVGGQSSIYKHRVCAGIVYPQFSKTNRTPRTLRQCYDATMKYSISTSVSLWRGDLSRGAFNPFADGRLNSKYERSIFLAKNQMSVWSSSGRTSPGFFAFLFLSEVIQRSLRLKRNVKNGTSGAAFDSNHFASRWKGSCCRCSKQINKLEAMEEFIYITHYTIYYIASLLIITNRMPWIRMHAFICIADFYCLTFIEKVPLIK